MAIKKPEETEVKDRYNKSTILQSAKYKNRRDLLNVLLDCLLYTSPSPRD